MHYLFIIFLLAQAGRATGQAGTAQKIALGHLPVVATDATGGVHLAFGQDSLIYYTTAAGGSESFAPARAVAVLPKLVSTAKRSPQLAVTNDYLVITAVNRAGDVFAYSMDRRTGEWSSATRINDVAAVALEGFQAVAGAENGIFHAVWLDMRENEKNKIVGATSTDGGRSWSANRLIYQSPSGTVCECCRVSMAARGADVYVQFRNFVDGARDLYLAHSSDYGKTFASVQKLGAGTWKLNACPMDGGTVVLSPTGQPLTAWRRDTLLYTCQPGQPEQKLASGRNVTLSASAAGLVTAWDNQGTVWLKTAGTSALALGRGQMPSLALSGRTVVCVWEASGQVMLARIPL